MPPKLSLSNLTSPHRDVAGKETCTACLEHLVDEQTLIERDASLKPKQRRLQLEKKASQIKRLYWKSDAHNKSGDRYKHFAFCPRQAADTRESCKKAREKQQSRRSSAVFSDEEEDAPRKKVRVKGKATGKPTKVVLEPTRKSSREGTSKRKYVVESEVEQMNSDEEEEDMLSRSAGAVAVSSGTRSATEGKQKAVSNPEQPDDHADFSEYFAPSQAVKRARRESSTSASTARSRSTSPSDSLFSTHSRCREPSLSTAPTTASESTESRSLSAASATGVGHASGSTRQNRDKAHASLLAAYAEDSDDDEANVEDDQDYDYVADAMKR